jgi:hypothetical protein
MLIRTFAVFCLCGVVLGADASQDVAAAATKLRDAGNYSWRSVTNDTADNGSTLITDGKTDKSAYTTLNLNSGDYYVRLVIKGTNGAINTGDGWKTADDLSDNRREAKFLTATVRGFKSPAVLAQEFASHAKDLHPEEDALVTEVSGNEAAQLLSPLANVRSGREMSNAKATVRFWIRDGILAKYQVHATYTVSLKGNDTQIDRTTTVDFSDAGTTTVDVPDEVKKKLEPVTQSQ